MKSKKSSLFKRAFFQTIALSLLLIFGFTHQSPAITYFVDDDGTYDQLTATCDGNDSCYDIIQSGIDAASSGDIVKVCPGTYDQTFTMKTGVDVLSAETTAPLIAPTSGDNLVAFDGADSCTLDGFDLDASSGGTSFASGVIYVNGYTNPCTDVTISNCNIKGYLQFTNGASAGIRLWGEVSVNIIGNTIYDNCFAGISTGRVSGNAIENSSITIKGNTIEDNGTGGIYLKGSGPANQLIIGESGYGNGNTISDNGVWAWFGGAAGIRLENIDQVRIENNNIFNNASAGMLLISVTTTSPHIRNNDIHHNNRAGINIGGASEVTIGDNNQIYNNLAGIAFFVFENSDIPGASASSEQVTITGNEIYSNSRAGIAVIDNTTGTIMIDDNEIHQNSKAGIAIFNECTAEITDNEIYTHTVAAGIFTGDWSGTYPPDPDNPPSSLKFDRTNGPANLTIKRNKIYENRAGMRLDHASGTIHNNLVYGNSRAGIRFSGNNVSPYSPFSSSWGITEIKNNTAANNGSYIMELSENIGGGIVYDDINTTEDPITGLDRNFFDRPVGATQDPITIKNNIVANNKKSGIKFCADNSANNRSHNLFYENYEESCATGEAVDCGRMCRCRTLGRCYAPGVNCCDQETWCGGWVWATGEICGQDPLFNSDYTLQIGSPAIGAGDDMNDMGAYGGTDPIT